MSGLRGDVRLAFRQVRRKPMLALVTIAIIAFSVGAAAAVFAVADGALLRPLPFGDGERLYFLTDTQGDNPGLPASLPELRDWQSKLDVMASMAAFHTTALSYETTAGAEIITGAGVAGDARGVIGLDAVRGRWFTDAEQRAGARVTMVSETFWRNRLNASASVVGETMRFDGKPFTIVGVAPDAAGVIRAGRAPQVWLPLAESPVMGRGLHFLSVVGRTRPDVSEDRAAAAVAALSGQLINDGVSEHGIGMRSAREVIVGDARKLLVVLAGATLLMLLIASSNLANLFLTRSLDQTREFAVRAALGARPWAMVRQTIAETTIIGIIGGIAAAVFAQFTIRTVAGLAQRAGTLAPLSVLDVRVLAFTLGTAVLVGLAFGLWPALRASRNDPGAQLRGSGRASATRSTMRGRRLLVAAEIALSVVLLTQAGLLIRSMRMVLREKPGFDPSNVLTLTVALRGDRYSEDAAQLRVAEELQARIAALPGVVATGYGTHLPLDGSSTDGTFEIVGRTFAEGDEPISLKRAVSPGYFAALAIPLLRGRDFSSADRPGAPDVVIISEAIAKRYWPGEDPIGKRIEFGWGPGEQQTVVGVVGDVRHDAIENPVELGTIYRAAGQFPMRSLSIAVRHAGDAGALTGPLRAAVKSVDATAPIGDLQSMHELVTASTATRRTLMLLIAGLAAIALLISVVGVYAVTAHAVSQRTVELGIRMALGARAGNVLSLVLRQELWTVAAGMLVGIGGALAGTRVLRSSLYGVSTRDPVTFAVVALALGCAAVIAALVPARRVAGIAPTMALRGDAQS